MIPDLSRRALLRGTSMLVPVAALAACATGTSAATLDAQILADASGAVNGVSAVATQVNALKPGAISSTVIAGLTAAKGLVASLSASTPAPTGATTLQTVDTDISNALTALAAVLPAAAIAFPVLAPAIPAVDAVIALLPTIESYVNPLITSITSPTVAAAAPIKPIAQVMSVAQARAVLGVPVVK